MKVRYGLTNEFSLKMVAPKNKSLSSSDYIHSLFGTCGKSLKVIEKSLNFIWEGVYPVI